MLNDNANPATQVAVEARFPSRAGFYRFPLYRAAMPKRANRVVPSAFLLVAPMLRGLLAYLPFCQTILFFTYTRVFKYSGCQKSATNVH